MRDFLNITSDRILALGIFKIFGLVIPFRRTCLKLPDLAITFQIIGGSILIGAAVLGGGLNKPRHVVKYFNGVL
jgi:uncharacterized MnhB-related membrane protein